MSKKLRLLVSVALLGWLAWCADWSRIAHIFRHLRLELWLAAVLLYVLTLFRAQLPIGDAALQLTTLVLGVLAILAWRAAAPTRPNPARPPQAASTQHDARALRA